MDLAKHRPPGYARTLPFFFLAALVILAYAGTLRAQFVYDDHTQLEENVALRSLRNIPSFFTDPAHTSGSMIFEEIYRPLRATVFAIEYQLWGLNPAGFHAVNILFHLLNTFLVFIFLRWLLQAPKAAFGAALLFAVHPALTENVCWICSRSDLLCMFFYLLGLIFFYRYREESSKRRRLYYFVALVTLLLTLLSKEMGVTFPAAVVAIDIWREGWKGQSPRRWLEYAPLWIVTLGYLAFRATVMSQFAQREAWGSTAFATAGLMARGITYYIRLLVFPFNLTLIPGIDLTVPLLSFETIASSSLVIGLLLFAVICRRRFPIATLGIILFFILLLPVSNIVPIKAVVGDRFVYLPSLGFFLLAGAGLRALEQLHARRESGQAALVAGLVVIPVFLLSINTVARSVDWKDGFSLYKAAVEVKPNHPRPRELLAKEYFVMGDYEAAREHSLVAVRANPLSVDAHSLLGAIYLQQGLLRQAEQELKLALELDPKNGDSRTNLGIVYQQQGKLDEALEHLQIARKNNPMVSEILNNIGSVLLSKGQPATALEYLHKAVEIKPYNLEAACNLSYALLSLQKYDDAARTARSYLASYPADYDLLLLLGQACSGAGDKRGAAEAYHRALRMNPADTKAALALADIFMSAGNYDGAADVYRSLLARFPTAVRFRLTLASALEQAGNLELAIQELETAARLVPEDTTLKDKIRALKSRQ